MQVIDCKVDRYTREYMGSSGVSKGQLMDMVVTDDIARLRMQFSGLRMWGHIISLLVFCAPYSCFLLQQWFVAKFYKTPQEIGDTLTISEAFFRYILNGGAGWQEGRSPNWYPLMLFCHAAL